MTSGEMPRVWQLLRVYAEISPPIDRALVDRVRLRIERAPNSTASPRSSINLTDSGRPSRIELAMIRAGSVPRSSL
jgi:hypothetical protein